MKKIFAHVLSRYMYETEGATAVEYGLIGAFIAVGISAVVGLAGDEIAITFNTILTELQG
ncbi:MAG: Flp family type IVb pilin [Alphaproteobacteria bacterium]|nr:Flp family type IVb pilin [Alphaproteobacteria bacterium]